MTNGIIYNQVQWNDVWW